MKEKGYPPASISDKESEHHRSGALLHEFKTLAVADTSTKEKLCCLIFLSGCDKCIWDLTDDIRLSVLTIDESKSTLLSISTGVAARRRLNDLNLTTTHLQVQTFEDILVSSCSLNL